MQETAESTPEKLVVEGRFSGFTPEELFQYWVQPELITQWWPEEAVIDAREGGSFALSWPDMNWHLRGTYTVFEPGKRLGFTWKWDHDKPGWGPLQVMLTFAADAEGGTDMKVEHGPFGPDDAEERQGILEGWIHFGMHLAGLRVSTG